jgi:methionine biosynthesis protein MetW
MFALELKRYRGRVDLGVSNASWTKIVNLVPEGSRVLEIGCAEGYMSEFLSREKRCDVVGIELNAKAAATARMFCEEVIVGDVEEGALEDAHGPFGVIIFADVLEHLRNPGSVLSRTASLLSEHGCVLISVPNVAHWDVRSRMIRGRFDYTETGLLDSTHLRFFTYDSIQRLIRDAGFAIQVSDLTHGLPRHWKYPGFYDHWDRPLCWMVNRFFRGLFGYQFIFKLRLNTSGDETGAAVGGSTT